ncbi:MAG TPA: hypothetical protein HA224_03835 [Nanoarchaeota archaeon]|nr:hypothetical protein [Nanoarchaeota archaeon]
MAYETMIHAQADSGIINFIFPFESEEIYKSFQGFLATRALNDERALKHGWTAVAWYLDGEPNRALRLVFYNKHRLEKDLLAPEIDPSDALDSRPADLVKIIKAVPLS